jgi:hypothetical protein
MELYVIEKRFRNTPIETPTPISVYYILKGVIFQAPTLKRIIEAKA